MIWLWIKDRVGESLEGAAPYIVMVEAGIFIGLVVVAIFKWLGVGLQGYVR
jgi:hypothetical protein